MNKIPHFSTRTIAYAAMMTALVCVTGLIGVNVGTGYLNFGDTMILVAASLFGPVTGLIAGGLGAFLTDLIVYPATMWFTLAIKGLEGLLCGLAVRYGMRVVAKRPKAVRAAAHAGLSLLCTAEMVIGYYLTQRFLWGTAISAWEQLPFDALQAVVSATLSAALIYGLRLQELVRGKQPAVADDRTRGRDSACAPPDDDSDNRRNGDSQ